MSNEEAQELIAEIDKKYGAQYGTYLVPPAEQVCSEIKKIITRFANKPPYKMQVLYGDLILYQHNLDDEFHLSFSTDGKVRTTSFNQEQLIQLRDNINKMLEYLNDE